MDVLAGRILLHPVDLARSQRFYRDVLGLAVYREFGDPARPGIVFFLGGGYLEVSGAATLSAAGTPSAGGVELWLQVRDVRAEHDRLAGLGVPIRYAPRSEPWGLVEMRIADPDGVEILLVQVPDGHPLRRDSRALDP